MFVLVIHLDLVPCTLSQLSENDRVYSISVSTDVLGKKIGINVYLAAFSDL